MKCNGGFIAWAAVLLAVAAGLSAGSDKPRAAGAGDRAADEAGVREAAEALARAFEKGDAPAVAAFWTEEGEFVDEDSPPIRGRAAIEKAYAAFFAKRPALKVHGKTDQVRFVGKDTAVEEGTFTVRAKGAPARSSRYSSLYVRQDGRWLIALLKEWNEEATGAPRLDNLAWLIGTWATDGVPAKARTRYEWAENKKFIRAHYTIETTEKGKRVTHSGTQMIGIDPAGGGIRAWTFDSDGGVGEAHWHWDGERWAIEAAGTLGDGSEMTALNLLTRSGDDAFTWRSVQRTENGERLPDLPTVKVHRVTTEP